MGWQHKKHFLKMHHFQWVLTLVTQISPLPNSNYMDILHEGALCKLGSNFTSFLAILKPFLMLRAKFSNMLDLCDGLEMVKLLDKNLSVFYL